MAIGVLSVLSITGVTMVSYANSNTRSAAFSQDNGAAYDLAEAGLNEIIAILSKPANNSLTSNLLPLTTALRDRDRHLVGDAQPRHCDLVRHVHRNDQESDGRRERSVTRTLTAKIPVTATVAQPLNNPSWNYMFATQTGNSCDMTLTSSVQIAAPLYVMGNLCLDSSSWVSGGPLVVMQQLKLLTSSNKVGTSGTPVGEVHVGQGCKYMSNAVHNPCKNGAAPTNDNVWATTLTNTPVTLSPPVVNWDSWYQNAMPGPSTDCTSTTGARSGTPPTFENQTSGATRNNSVSGVFNLTPSSSYTCRVGPANSPIGELSWNASTKTLTTSGTIFIDGSATVNNGLTNNYNGQATLYLSGTFLINGSSQLCGGVSSATATSTPGTPTPRC